MREAHRYQLPMAILLETMQGLSATVALRAHIASLPEGWNEPCLANLIIVQGVLHTCTITTMEGLLLLQWEAAFHMLERLGELEWTLYTSFPDEHHHPPQAHASMGAGAVSWKVAPAIMPVVFGTLPHRQKQVLLLLESQKHPEEIARLLGMSVPQVEQILHELASQQVISRQDERKTG